MLRTVLLLSLLHEGHSFAYTTTKTTTTTGQQNHPQHPQQHSRSRSRRDDGGIVRRVSASLLDSNDDPKEKNPLRTTIMDDLRDDMVQADAEDAATEELLSRRRAQLRDRVSLAGAYRIQLPLNTATTTSSGSVLFGLTVSETLRRQRRLLNLDTMQLYDDDIDMDSDSTNPNTALTVHTVLPDSPADRAGVRPGDVVTAVSATLGGRVWPTSTLQGVQSAISSRTRLAAKTVTLELRRPSNSSSIAPTATTTPAEAAVTSSTTAAEEREARRIHDTSSSTATSTTADSQFFELTLARPLGFNIGQDEEDGYVVVTEIGAAASNMVRYGILVGDRVVAVSSSLNDQQLWPVSTVEGVVAAVTGRLPHQSVTMRFERPVNNDTGESSSSSSSSSDAAVMASDAPAAPLPTLGTVAKPVSTAQAPVEPKELIQRCRDVLRRYVVDKTSTPAARQMSAAVTDKVVDALASASSTIDCVTLSMIMNAYSSSGKAAEAIRIFELTTGFAGDGSCVATAAVATSDDAPSIVPSESALNLYTATALLQAHATVGDHASVLRVLAALEGRSGVVHNGLESAPWPWTGPYGSIQPDTTCYNIAIGAAEKVGGSEALLSALTLFDNMSDVAPTKNGDSSSTVKPAKNAVTYNTLISALCNAGRSNAAFDLFEKMKRSGLRPDKYTYTSLIKACDHEGDVKELLYDMQERGVQPDVVTYNTMIRTLCQSRQLMQATKLVTEMESKGVSPDSRTYGLLMNGLLDTRKPAACLALFDSACANGGTAHLTANVHLYTTAITAASKMGDHERALALVSRMTGSGVQPNVKTLTAVMGACLASDKPELAVQLYRKMDAPDGYAMRQCIRALCLCGTVAEAAEMVASQTRGRRRLSGKEMMMSYNNILHCSLTQNNYELARTVLSDLLEKGYIPNKTILLSMANAMGLNRRPSRQEVPEVQDVDEDHSKFRFLLFAIDAFQQRNLPIEGVLYASAVDLGGHLGSLPRRIASRMTQAKTAVVTGSKKLVLSQTDKDSTESKVVAGWEELYSVFDTVAKEDLKAERLPPLPVRVAPRDMTRILRAEQTVSNSQRRKLATSSSK